MNPIALWQSKNGLEEGRMNFSYVTFENIVALASS